MTDILKAILYGLRQIKERDPLKKPCIFMNSAAYRKIDKATSPYYSLYSWIGMTTTILGAPYKVVDSEDETPIIWVGEEVYRGD